MAKAASSKLAIQQILTRGARVAFMGFPPVFLRVPGG
jgi:hypothetical protein